MLRHFAEADKRLVLSVHEEMNSFEFFSFLSIKEGLVIIFFLTRWCIPELEHAPARSRLCSGKERLNGLSWMTERHTALHWRYEFFL